MVFFLFSFLYLICCWYFFLHLQTYITLSISLTYSIFLSGYSTQTVRQRHLMLQTQHLVLSLFKGAFWISCLRNWKPLKSSVDPSNSPCLLELLDLRKTSWLMWQTNCMLVPKLQFSMLSFALDILVAKALSAGNSGLIHLLRSRYQGKLLLIKVSFFIFIKIKTNRRIEKEKEKEKSE